jgi:predicted nuclease of predicted toxin-antitoxin system
MNIVADESIDGPIVAELRHDGHSVEYVAEMAPGISDDAVLDHANSRQAVLMTADKDFGELVFRLQRVSSGVILIRLSGLSPSSKAHLVSASLRTHAARMLHAFTVISTGRIRIRHGA